MSSFFSSSCRIIFLRFFSLFFSAFSLSLLSVFTFFLSLYFCLSSVLLPHNAIFSFCIKFLFVFSYFFINLLLVLLYIFISFFRILMDSQFAFFWDGLKTFRQTILFSFTVSESNFIFIFTYISFLFIFYKLFFSLLDSYLNRVVYKHHIFYLSIKTKY